MAKVELYSNGYCNECTMAAKLLESKRSSNEDFQVDVKRVDEDEYLFIEMIGRSDRLSVPQIFVNDTCIGGYSDLLALDQAGKLDALLANTMK